MGFSFKNYFKNFTSSTGNSLANIGTFGLYNAADSIYDGQKEFDNNKKAKNEQAKQDFAIADKAQKDEQFNIISAAEDEKERLRKARQPGRRQTLLNLQGGSSLLTGF